MLGLYKTCADYINSVGKRENSASVVINTQRKKKSNKTANNFTIIAYFG